MATRIRRNYMIFIERSGEQYCKRTTGKYSSGELALYALGLLNESGQPTSGIKILSVWRIK